MCLRCRSSRSLGESSRAVAINMPLRWSLGTVTFKQPLKRFALRCVYSWRSAIIGSTFVARRAGIQQASNATTSSSVAMTVSVSGSVGLTP